MTDEQYMRRAISLARGGEGKTNPNPLVGAVIVKDGRVIGEGFHHACGDLHAEREALKNCYQNGESPKGGEIYVTLEPCCHFGKQPPCTQALVEAGISRVIVGSRDPNPLVHGKGNAYLRENGITVEEDFLRSECDALNPIFFHYITTKTPYVAIKYAMTLDGKIATKTGESKWITNEEARAYVHVLRNRYSAILAGIGTVLSDNPMLNCRLTDENGKSVGRNPIRIICDSDLKIPLQTNIVKTAKEIPTIVACLAKNRDSGSQKYFDEKKRDLESLGVEVLVLEPSDRGESGRVDLPQLLKVLGEKNIDSVLFEGGSEIHYSALKSKIVNKIYAFVAPKFFGGKAKSPVEGEGVNLPGEAYQFELENVQFFGNNVLLEYRK
ncbi:bifunctional diaminohydroxyphosphoribosylaminopyrimidine deaminase/5-amino-6-(5-phosphoribosylamino)uracil reductase RibD [Treponema sp.]|uniref:bifunctional diaminohydroxyphosphoribosylaminopyrimidine deaminase/5-amino-6-(5-phosphoribosylamino)uracil reductase RibD n=1 Tax=Treponema sp. TaxID=166 RepID=UPI0025F06DEE|nr:bifunctional diaminohydroxyphosphoribosylaminopyrimidine deaminase/5-amino-6-(5-phosphoribosylamino)uracil reductase RibD [Treponema sp.]